MSAELCARALSPPLTCVATLILHKDHISTGKSTQYLGILKSETLDSFGELDEDTLLRLGLLFVSFLTINQTIRWEIKNL